MTAKKTAAAETTTAPKGFFVQWPSCQVFAHFGNLHGKVNRGIAHLTWEPADGHVFANRAAAARVAKRFHEWNAKVIPADVDAVRAQVLAKHEAEVAAQRAV